MLTFILDIVLIAGGYTAAICTWPKVRSLWHGSPRRRLQRCALARLRSKRGSRA